MKPDGKKILFKKKKFFSQTLKIFIYGRYFFPSLFIRNFKTSFFYRKKSPLSALEKVPLYAVLSNLTQIQVTLPNLQA